MGVRSNVLHTKVCFQESFAFSVSACMYCNCKSTDICTSPAFQGHISDVVTVPLGSGGWSKAQQLKSYIRMEASCDNYIRFLELT